MFVLLFKDLGTSTLFILPKDPLSKWWRQDLNPHSLAPVTALNQWSPDFLAPGTSFLEDNFSTDGVGRGWFRQ